MEEVYRIDTRKKESPRVVTEVGNVEQQSGQVNYFEVRGQRTITTQIEGSLTTESVSVELRLPHSPTNRVQLQEILEEVGVYLGSRSQSPYGYGKEKLSSGEQAASLPQPEATTEVRLLRRFQQLAEKETNGNISTDELIELDRLQNQLDQLDEERWHTFSKPFYEQEARKQTEHLERLRMIEVELRELRAQLSRSQTA